MPEHFAGIVQRFPGHEAVVSLHQGRRLTYAELAEEVDTFACGLLGMGFGKGDRIGIWSTNNIEWLLIQMAAARIGALLVCINPAYRASELARALQHSEVQALFAIPAFRSSDYAAMLAELVPELKEADKNLACKGFPFLRRVVLFDPTEPSETSSPQPGVTTWAEVLEAAADISTETLNEITTGLDRDETIGLLYTSGSLGFPKTAALSHHNLLNNACFTAMSMHFTEQDRLCVPVPFYHCFGMVLASLLCLTVGGCMVLPGEYFDALEVLKAIEDEKCTAVHGVPTMFIAELEHPRFREYDLSSLRTGIMAGAPCPPALVKRVIEEMSCSEILIGYGMTEASPLTHLTSREDPMQVRLETVGRNLPHQEVKIVDPHSRKTVPLGDAGEICFRGYHIAKGYYGDPEATKEAIDESGWLHSGDLGAMDEKGYVRVLGRQKEIIIRGGENISPWQIEQFLLTHPKVAEVAVFGVPHESLGEEIMAWIKLHAGVTATELEIREYCQGQISHFKIPKYIWFVKEFPLTVSGKMQKFRMRDIALKKMREGKTNR
ncbi:MAG: AMP-binding protein [Desulfuromonadales bacterium]|nr:AMP-binding protein [Desulfuromonadales bacterium]